MSTYLFGFLISIGVVIGPIMVMAKNHLIYISLEGLVVVIGGTIAITLASFPFKKVRLMLYCMLRITRREVDDSSLIAREIIRIAQATKGERALIANILPSVRHPFIRDGLGLIVDKLENEIEEILNDRIVTKQREEEKIIGMVRVLGKFPPALGLLATVLSLITLLDGLGGDKLGVNSLGPAMAVGLVGTLYGIVLSNLFFAPVAENLHAKTKLEVQNRRIALVGLVLIAQKKNPLLVQEMVNSQLSPSERVDVLGTEGRSAA